jgi:toxin ParE1/3/4
VARIGVCELYVLQTIERGRRDAEGLSDLEAIGEYVDRPSPQYASAIVGRLYTSVEPLAEHPKMGRQGPEVAHETLRELIVENDRAIYQRGKGTVEVSRGCAQPSPPEWGASSVWGRSGGAERCPKRSGRQAVSERGMNRCIYI